MKHTTNFRLIKPEYTDYYDIEDFNTNADAIDAELQRQKNVDIGQDEKIKELQNPTYTVAESRKNIVSGEKIGVIFGKIARFFSDLKTVAFSGSYEDLSNKPQSLPANGGNAATVNKHTVNSDVPSGAKFTDTNTWRGIQNNLTSDSTTDSLSAAQGKALKGLVDGKAASNHTHLYPGGFAGTDNMAWGVQTGGVVCGWADGAGGSIGFRKNCPATGQVSMVIDGTVYTNEGKDQVLTSGNYSAYAAAKSHTHSYIPLSTAGGIASCGGEGKYTYFNVATIKITASYINRPIVFELSGRGKCLSQVTVIEVLY